MTRQGDAQIEGFVSGNAYDFIPPRISIAKNVQAVVHTVECLARARKELRLVIIESIELLEYSSRLMQESNELAESRGLKTQSNNATANERSKLIQYLTHLIP